MAGKKEETSVVYNVEFYLHGGRIIVIKASDLQVGIVPDTDDDGNPNQNAGELTGFKVDSLESEQLAYLYVRIPQIDAIRATRMTGSV